MPVSGWTSSRCRRPGRTRWEGRLEILRRSPMLLVDGAHNPAGAATLCRALQKGFPRRRLILIFGVLGDKDYPAMVEEALPPGRPGDPHPAAQREGPAPGRPAAGGQEVPQERRSVSKIRAMPCGPPFRGPGRRISSVSPVPSIWWEKSRKSIRPAGRIAVPEERAR